MINPVEAFFDVGIQNVFGFMADDRENGCDRIVTGPARSEAVAVGGKACFSFGFEHTVGQRLEGAVVYGGDTQRPHVVGPRFWYPYPTHRCGFVTQGQGLSQRQPLRGGEGFDPIHACRFFPLIMCSTGSCGVQATDIGATMVPSRGTPHDLCEARMVGERFLPWKKAFDAHLAHVGCSCWPDEPQRAQRTRSGSCGTLLPERRSITG